MAPQVLADKEVILKSRVSKATLRVSLVTPRSNSDFISTQGSVSRDIGFFAPKAPSANAGIAVDAFYVGAAKVKSFQLGNDLFIKDSKDNAVVIVHLDD